MLCPGPFQRGLRNHLSTLVLPGDITQVIAQSSRTVPPGYCLFTLGNLGIFSNQTQGQLPLRRGNGEEKGSGGAFSSSPRGEIEAAIRLTR